MKKIISIFAILSLILICLCIIAVLRPVEEIELEPISDEIASKQAELILQGIIKQDTQAIRDMFNKKKQGHDDLEEQIEKAYEFIQGQIVSYDPPIGGTLEDTYIDGETQYEALWGSTINIETDQGKRYSIDHDAIHICDDKDAIGVCTITIMDRTDADNHEVYIIGQNSD